MKQENIIVKTIKSEISLIPRVDAVVQHFTPFPLNYNFMVGTDGSIYNIKSKRWLSASIEWDIIGGIRKCKAPHIVVAITYMGQPSGHDYLQVNHINMDKSDNRLCNLEWCDSKYNCRHAVTLLNRMSKVATFIESDELVHQICSMLESGESSYDIGSVLGVVPNEVYRIKAGQRWQHISKDYKLPEIKNITSRMEDELVEQICKYMSENPETVQDVADTFGVSRHKVADLRAKVAYKHITSKYTFLDKKRGTFSITDEQKIHKICSMLEGGVSCQKVVDLLDVQLSEVRGVRSGRHRRDISSGYVMPIPKSRSKL